MNTTVYHNAQILILESDEFQIVDTLVVKGGFIDWVGVQANCPIQQEADKSTASVEAVDWHDCQQRVITPGLIDCHTHLIYAGDRTEEAVMRRDGVSYETLSRQGKGILTTVDATQAASTAQLKTSAEQRLKTLQRNGVLTVEIKSGYGLSLDAEHKQLAVATMLAPMLNGRITRTFLGAHTFPKSGHASKEAYVLWLANEVLPKLHSEQLVDAVDAYIEPMAFTPSMLYPLYQKAADLKLPLRGHAGQFTTPDMQSLLNEFGDYWVSLDHLEYADETLAQLMSTHDITAVLLPGAMMHLRQTQQPPVECLRDHKVKFAVATDHNPGTSPTLDLQLMGYLAWQHLGLTVHEVLSAMTLNPANVLSRQTHIGQLAKGFEATFCIWDTTVPNALVTTFGQLKPYQIVDKGIPINANTHR